MLKQVVPEFIFPLRLEQKQQKCHRFFLGNFFSVEFLLVIAEHSCPEKRQRFSAKSPRKKPTTTWRKSVGGPSKIFSVHKQVQNSKRDLERPNSWLDDDVS